MTDNPTQLENKLEPCYCRSKTDSLSLKSHIDHGDFGCRERGRYVYCSNCWAHGPTFNTDAEARDGWNRFRVRVVDVDMAVREIVSEVVVSCEMRAAPPELRHNLQVILSKYLPAAMPPTGDGKKDNDK